jgi:hypothetical protein
VRQLIQDWSATFVQRSRPCCRCFSRSGTARVFREREHFAKARKGLDRLAVGPPGKGLLHPRQIAKAISDQAAADSVFTCDVGHPAVYGLHAISR